MDLATRFDIEMRPPGRLKPYAANARRHSRKQIQQIAGSIRRFGFTNPVLVSDDGQRLIYVISPDPWTPLATQPGQEVLDQDDVLHIPGFGFDGRRGLSPLRYALRMTGAVALATQEYSARFFANVPR